MSVQTVCPWEASRRTLLRPLDKSRTQKTIGANVSLMQPRRKRSTEQMREGISMARWVCVCSCHAGVGLMMGAARRRGVLLYRRVILCHRCACPGVR